MHIFMLNWWSFRNRLCLLCTYCIVFFVGSMCVHGQITMRAVGDVMLGSLTPDPILPAENGKEFVRSIGAQLRGASIVFGNLEGAFVSDKMRPQKCSDSSRKASRCYEFGMPLVLAPTLRDLGFTVMSTDNNHSDDYGKSGYDLTLSTLVKLGIQAAPKRGFASLLAGKTRIAVVAFGFGDDSYSINDLPQAKKVIESLQASHNVIIVSFHGGAEGKKALHVPHANEIFLGEERGNVEAFAHTVIDAGAHIVIGHGPHVVRALENYKGRLIAYSLGNFLTHGNFNIKQENGYGVILEVEFSENGTFRRGKLISTRQVGRGIPEPDPEKKSIELVKRLTKEDFPDTHIRIIDNGEIYLSK